MAKGHVLQPIFKAYHQNQVLLLPPGLEELIAANHPVRIINEVLNKIDIRPLMQQYKTGGAGNYHPGMLLKVLVYGYINNIYSIHQNTTDTTTLTTHLEQFKEQYQMMPEVITADAGYGSEENYQYLSDNNIKSYVKYNHFDNEQHTATQEKKPFTADKLYYNRQQDYYVCPIGQHMHNTGTSIKTTTTGFIQTITRYSAKNCSNCPLNGSCHKSKANRVIEINHRLNALKKQAKQKLETDTGIYHRKKRCAGVEPVFANIKNNHGFKRFMLRGKQKVTIGTGLLST